MPVAWEDFGIHSNSIVDNFIIGNGPSKPTLSINNVVRSRPTMPESEKVPSLLETRAQGYPSSPPGRARLPPTLAGGWTAARPARPTGCQWV